MVCGPSGAGKTTVMNMLLESFPSKVSRVPALTTKIPYKSEAYGLPYVNLTASELASEVANGDAFGQCRFVKLLCRTKLRVCKLPGQRSIFAGLS